MMRITDTQQDGPVTRLRLEGRITQDAVEELKSACSASLAEHRALLLDLAEVRFADAVGIAALVQQVRRGAVLVGCSGFLAELIREHEEKNEQATTTLDRNDEHANEVQFLEDLRRGEEQAFERLVRQYGGRMLATARRVLSNDHDAQDAVQEAFLSAFRAIDQFNGDAKLSTWLRRIVINAALMKIRSRRRKPEETIEELLPHFDVQGHWASEISHWTASSDELLQRKETRALVRQCIDRLPETYRAIVVLRDIEELDTEEVASLLGITANAVKIRLHRARQALRTLIERTLITKSSSEGQLSQVCSATYA